MPEFFVCEWVLRILHQYNIFAIVRDSYSIRGPIIAACGFCMFFSCVYWFLTCSYADIALFFAKESAICGTRSKSYPWYEDIALYMKNVKWCKYNLNCFMQS